MIDRDPRAEVITVPTELEHQHPFYDLAGLALAVVAIKWLSNFDLQWWVGIPIVLAIGTWTLSGEPATDVPFIGAIASGVRSRLGLRRIHEWLLAYAHYARMRTLPDGRDTCRASLKWCRRQTTALRHQPSARIRWSRSRVSSWVWAIHSRLSARHAR
jgi:hypothetical protein